MRLYSWNVNGIRACAKNGFLKWMAKTEADIICSQETKARPEQLEPSLISPPGYRSYWAWAEKAGYSGVAIWSRTEPLDVQVGIGKPEFDSEGRVLIAEYKNFFLVNAYFPNSQPEHQRLKYKLHFCNSILKYCDTLQAKGKPVVLCGDYNIAHQEIDLRNPKQNIDCSGFLPEEREWMTDFLKSGYSDVFRKHEPGGGHYTWWSYRPGVRERNIGWRIDYHCVSDSFQDRVKKVWHEPQVMGSDHCPVGLELKK